MIEIDGSMGGGQILRTAVALSTLTNNNLHIFNIRAKRDNPGLRPQHLNAVRAVGKLCNAKIINDEVKSKEIFFEPQKIEARDLVIDVGTAGSTTLILQALLPAAINAHRQIRVEIIGGTNNEFSPPIDYVQSVFLPTIKKFGTKVELKLRKRGYYPKGGGKIEAIIYPSVLKPIELLERGKLVNITGISNATNSLKEARVAERIAESTKSKLEYLNVPINIKSEYSDSFSPGATISVFANYENSVIGSDGFGERGKPSEDVGEEAASKLIKEIESDATVDSHLADQLIPYLGLVGGRIKTSEVTEHTKTNIWVTEKFLPVKFSIICNQENCMLSGIQ